MNKHIKKTLVLLTTLTLLLGATFVSFAGDKLDSETIEIDPPKPTLYTSDSSEESKENVTPVLISEKIDDSFVNVLNDNFEMSYMDKKIDLDVKAVINDGKVMLPLSAVLNAMDYKYEWKSESSSIDIMKGSQFTTIYIGRNEYFKNKMAAKPLSASPIIIDGRTLVPAEFFVEILGLSFSFDGNSIQFSDQEMAIHSGYITEINKDEKGNLSLTISSKKDSTDMMDMTIIHTKKGQTFFNNSNIKLGEYVQVVSPLMMTMSIPGQTSGIVIY